LNADAYYIVNVAAEYDVGKGVTLFTRADNLFDRRYEDPVGFQRPGFGFFAGVRVAWDVKLPASQTAETDPEIYAKEKK
jgi:vitamin B12 transporter